MKNTLLFFLMTVLTISMSFGQNCDSIEAENQRLKTEVLELKEILLVTTPIMEFQADDINVKLLKITGDERTQTIEFEVLFTNSGVNIDKMTTGVKSIIEVGGNEVLLNKAILGAKEAKSRGFLGTYVELFRNTPLKCTYIFKGVVPEVKIIKAFPLPFVYHKEGTKSSEYIEDRVIFNDIEINWK
jgi:hypothetical protein